MSYLKPVVYAISFALLLVGCTKEESPSGEEKYVAPTSYKLLDENPNFPYGGTISTGNVDAPRGGEVVCLADGSVTTDYCTGQRTVDIVFESAQAFALNAISLVSSSETGSDPASMILHGSSDKSRWQQLCVERNLSFASVGEEKSWEVASDKKYRYYRLRLSAALECPGIRLAEWKMTENEVVDFSDLMTYATGKTYSDVTPMGKKFADVRVATAEQIAWLNDPTQNPPIEAATLNADNYMMKALEVNLYPYGSPSPADVNQHAIGDCCACAVFASFAYTRPQFIKSIITQNGNIFTVKMYNPAGEPITVKVNNEFICGLKGKLQALSGKNQIATWSTVLEKALMKWQYVYKYNYGIGGIGTEHVVPLFTGNGNSFAFSPGKLSPEQLERAVKGSLSQGYIVIGGFNKGDVIIENTYKSVTGHAFTLMYENSENGIFAMRNPWGGAAGSPDGKEDGVMNIPNNKTITDLIDLRICYPGSSLEYFEGAEAYFPPKFSASPYGLWNGSEQE